MSKNTAVVTSAINFAAQLFKVEAKRLSLRLDRSANPREPAIDLDMKVEHDGKFADFIDEMRKLGRVDSYTKYSRTSYAVDFNVNGTKCRVAIEIDWDNTKKLSVLLKQWNLASGDGREAIAASAKLACVSPKTALACTTATRHENGQVNFTASAAVGRAAHKKLTAKYGKPLYMHGEYVWDTPDHLVTIYNNDVFGYFATKPKSSK